MALIETSTLAAASRTCPADSNPDARPHAGRAFDSQLWLILALALAIIVPRSIYVSRATSLSTDDEHHLRRGLMYLHGQKLDLYLPDPVFGEALTALPLWAIGCDPRKPMNPATTPDPRLLRINTANPHLSEIARGRRFDVLLGNAYAPATLLLIVAIWKSVLFVPLVGLVFHWVRTVYGTPAGWLASLVLIFDPNFAANIHIAATDALGAEGIAFACFFAWRCIERPTWGRVIAAAVSAGIAMSIKHTAFVVPLVAAIFALLGWLRTKAQANKWSARTGDSGGAEAVGVGFRRGLRLACWGCLIVLLTIWAADRFDFSAPQDHGLDPVAHAPNSILTPLYNLVDRITVQPMPAGMYLASLVSAHNVHVQGHWAYLFGDFRWFGWWYFYAVVTAYKAPLGIIGLWTMALLSLCWRRPAFAEWSIVIPAAVFTGFIAWSGVDYAFRHFLPAYLFLLMLTGRALAPPQAGWKRPGAWLAGAVATLLLLAAAAHAATFTPDYVAYTNFPRHDVWLDINDKTLDYGQANVEIRDWVDAGARVPGGAPNRQVYVRYFDWYLAKPVPYWTGSKSSYLGDWAPRPTSGLLVLAPRFLVGDYDYQDAFGALRQYEPALIIGHCALVYDMDALAARGFRWPPLQFRHMPS
jgi:hypothetical protein